MAERDETGRLMAEMMVLGLGCRRGASPEGLVALAETVLSQAGVPPVELSAIATIRSRAHEPAIHAVADRFALPILAFDAATLERETPRLQNPSDVVFRETGCHGVAEAAALAAAGPRARLLVAKRKSPEGTAALAG